jgi:Homeodomain-like domain
VPESPERAAARKALARQQAARREAVAMCRLAECTARYAARELGNGLGPAEARQTALFVAAELDALAESLRKLTRMSGPERRRIARSLAALGWSRQRIAVRLGVSPRAVYGYLHRAGSCRSAGVTER